MHAVGQLVETLINDPTMILPKSGVNDIIKLSFENWVRYDSIMWTISALPPRQLDTSINFPKRHKSQPLNYDDFHFPKV